MGRKDCTEPQCLYKGALYLVPLPKSKHKCFRNTEKPNCCFETTDSTTYWYVTGYTYTAARTPNIRAFHKQSFNPLNAELNPICNLLALLGAHHFLHVSWIRVKSLTLRLLMSYIYIYIYMEHLFLMFLDHTQRRSTVSRTPLDE